MAYDVETPLQHDLDCIDILVHHLANVVAKGAPIADTPLLFGAALTDDQCLILQLHIGRRMCF